MISDLRIKILGFFFAVAAVLLLGRLFFWQVLRASYLSTQAKNQHLKGEEISAQRGSILSSDGFWLAASTVSYLVFAERTELKDDAKSIANKLATFFVEEKDDKEKLLSETIRIENLLSKKESVWVPIKHKVSRNIKNNIEALKISGIGFKEEESRFYPEASSSAHLLGFVGKDKDGKDKGYFGLEGFYDLSLSGKPGFLQRESDARGNPILFGESKEIDAIRGVDLVTHLDKTVQLVVEGKLQDALKKYGATSGLAVVMNPKNGAILSMAAFPSYDPLKYYDFSDEYFRNPVISESFEPGSIFKPMVMAAALDSEVVAPHTRCDICDGPVKVDKYTIKTWDNKYYPDSTMLDIIVHSDNVGMTFVGQKLGADKLYDYLKKFGFGSPTDIDLQGEANPALRKKGEWNIVDLATASFGQGIAATPIQIVQAFSVVANDGVMYKPQVVDKIKKGEWEHDLDSEKVGQVILKETAREIKEMMVTAVKNGEAKWTAAKGFKIAGKTGTAQIPISGHYDEEKTIASFVGFVPADEPKFVMLVTLREPTSSPWGSETAAPLWFDIAKELFPYFGIHPEN